MAKINRLFPWLAIIAGGIFLLASVLSAVTTVLFLRTAESTDATVIDVQQRTDRDRDRDDRVRSSIEYKAELEFTVDGQTYEFEEFGWSATPKEIGEQVEVLYDPDNPDQAVTDDQRWYLVWLGGLLGPFFLGLGFFLFWWRQRKSESGSDQVTERIGDEHNYVVEPSRDQPVVDRRSPRDTGSKSNNE